MTDLIDLLRAEKPAALLGSHGTAGDATVLVRRDHLLDVMEFLHNDPRCKMEQLMDVTAVDFLDYPEHLRATTSPLDGGGAAAERFEIVYHLLSMSLKHRLRVKVPVPADEPSVPTLSGLWLSAVWGEREAWDMYGMRFDGLQDHRRILMYEEFEGHPLRKDYPLRGYQPLVPMPELGQSDAHAAPVSIPRKQHTSAGPQSAASSHASTTLRLHDAAQLLVRRRAAGGRAARVRSEQQSPKRYEPTNANTSRRSCIGIPNGSGW